MLGLWVLLGTVAVALVAGAVLRAVNGRIRHGRSPAAELPEPVRELIDGGADVTLVQLSTTFCAPCRHARAVYGRLAERTDGVRHVELDVTSRPEVATALGVYRTPTTLAVDARGTELARITGVPKLDELHDALAPHLVRG
ncbi:MAG: thioredoxin [Pseudonocardiaceae bacterium]|nr:thioredoxin [Pseudonocardiaceae bacterium]